MESRAKVSEKSSNKSTGSYNSKTVAKGGLMRFGTRGERNAEIVLGVSTVVKL